MRGQSSSKGCGSPIMEPTPETGSGSMSAPAGGTGAPVVGVHLDEAVGVAGHQVDRTRRRRPEVAAEEAVGHREVLGVVPQARDRVAVVVAHGQAGSTEEAAAGVDADALDEQVHGTAVVSPLLGGVVVVLVAGQRLVGAEAERLVEVGVLLQLLRRDQVVVLGRVLLRLELGAAALVGRLGIGAEVVVVGDVLVEDHDHVLDGGLGLRLLRVDEGRGGGAGPTDERSRGGGDRRRRRARRSVRAGHGGGQDQGCERSGGSAQAEGSSETTRHELRTLPAFFDEVDRGAGPFVTLRLRAGLAHTSPPRRGRRAKRRSNRHRSARCSPPAVHLRAASGRSRTRVPGRSGTP